MTNDPTTTELRSAGQAFLIGPTYYLRPIDVADAATAPIWDPSPYPAPVEVVEERIKEKLARRDAFRAMKDEAVGEFIKEGDEKAFRAEVKNNMARELKNAIRNSVKNQVVEGLLKIHNVDLPRALVDNV